jgi:hypothetical protein
MTTSDLLAATRRARRTVQGGVHRHDMTVSERSVCAGVPTQQRHSGRNARENDSGCLSLCNTLGAVAFGYRTGV